MKRPVGVTILAILAIVGGIVLIFGGLSSLISGAFFAVMPIEVVMTQQQQIQQEIQKAAELHALIQFLGSTSIVMGAIVLAIGIGYLVVSYGLLKGKGLAWTITVILTIVSIVIQIVFVTTTSMLNTSLNHDANTSLYHLVDQIIGIAINGIILYYLYRPYVKTYFGKSQPSRTIQR